MEDLFTLARADAGQHPLVKREFYLDELVAEAAHSARALALEKEIALLCDTPEECLFFGDEGLLRRMVMNLVGNAIKYTPRGGGVSVASRAGRWTLCFDRVGLRPRDSNGAAGADIRSIFSRGYREVSRGRRQRRGRVGIVDCAVDRRSPPEAVWN